MQRLSVAVQRGNQGLFQAVFGGKANIFPRQFQFPRKFFQKITELLSFLHVLQHFHGVITVSVMSFNAHGRHIFSCSGFSVLSPRRSKHYNVTRHWTQKEETLDWKGESKIMRWTETTTEQAEEQNSKLNCCKRNAWPVGKEPLEDHSRELSAWLVNNLSVIKLILRWERVGGRWRVTVSEDGMFRRL